MWCCHSCRGLNVEGEADSWDFGVGAGFYVNATVDKWKNWRMYDYITKVECLLARITNTLLVCRHPCYITGKVTAAMHCCDTEVLGNHACNSSALMPAGRTGCQCDALAIAFKRFASAP